MKNVKRVFKNTPRYIWYLTAVVLVIILWLDFIVMREKFELFWVIGLIPIWIISYYTGIWGCILSVLLFLFANGITEVIEYFMHNENNVYLEIFSFSSLLILTSSIVTSILGYFLRLKDIQMKEIHENVDVTLWSYDLLTEKMMIKEGSVKPFGEITKEIEKDPILWGKYVHPDDLDSFIMGKQRQLDGFKLTLEYRVYLPDGEIIWVRDKTSTIKNDRGEVVKVYGFMIDVSQRKVTEQQLNDLAYRDNVTGLPNRYWFYESLEKATEEAKQNGSTIALLMIDFDNFKRINDTLGHNVGDMLLKQVTRRMGKCLREQDLLSRQGGDEFLVLMKDITDSEIETISNNIVESINEPIHLQGHDTFVTVSIGISTNKFGEEDPNMLLRHADLAMYLAKEKGKNNYQFYDEKLDQKIRRKTNLENALRKALKKDEYLLFYQPKVGLQTNKVMGLETLLRWNSPFGMIGPKEFIPILEETGLIVEVGEWVLKNACVQCKKWMEKGHDVKIAVNISARQLKDEDFVQKVKNAIAEAHLKPECLELEMTESIMFDVTESSCILEEIKDLGVKIAIDDFGIGFSSLNVVKNFDIDNLKIDQSFLHDVMQNHKTATILKSLIEIGKNLNTKVIVEGVETEDHVNFLKPLGIIAQGYYFSRPVPVKEAEDFLSKYK